VGLHQEGRPVQGRLKVFIVEDCLRIREGLGESLEDGGFEVVGCSRIGDATVQRLYQARPDVCVVGLGLSGTRAIRVCRALSAQPASLPCVVLALRHRPAEEACAFRAGAAAYVLAGLPVSRLARVLTAVACRPGTGAA
jgi:DNA-binding NarL/FixJ family response regulator